MERRALPGRVHAQDTLHRDRTAGLRPVTSARVLFVNDHVGHTGGTTYLLNVLGRLAEFGVQPRLCVLRAPHPVGQELAALGCEPVFLGRSKWDPMALADLHRLIGEMRPDILHLNGMKSHLLGRIAAMRSGVPSIVHLHFEYTPRPAWLQRALHRSTDKVLAVSQRLARRAVEQLRIPPSRVEVLHNGLDLRPFRAAGAERVAARVALGIGEGRAVICMPGRITFSPDKGHREMVRAMAAIRAAVPDSLLLIVGEGPDRPACEALSERLGLSANIRFLGQSSEIPKLLAASDIVTIPSMCQDAFTYVAVEAAAAGRPVVAFRSGGIPEAVREGETGLLVPRGDVAGLAAAAIGLIEDPSRRAAMGAAAAGFANTFEIDRHVARLAEIYRALANPAIPPRAAAAAA